MVLIHTSTPSIFFSPSLIRCRLLFIPLWLSYTAPPHTHTPPPPPRGVCFLRAPSLSPKKPLRHERSSPSWQAGRVSLSSATVSAATLPLRFNPGLPCQIVCTCARARAQADTDPLFWPSCLTAFRALVSSFAAARWSLALEVVMTPRSPGGGGICLVPWSPELGIVCSGTI